MATLLFSRLPLSGLVKRFQSDEPNRGQPRLNLPFAAIAAAIFSAMPWPCGAALFTNAPIADAFVATGPTGNLSGDNFGAAGALAVAAGDLSQGEFQTVIQFDLSAATSAFNADYGAGDWTVQSMTLELIASGHGNSIFNNPAAGQFEVSLMRNNSWVEGTGTGGAPTTDGITYNSLQGVYINNATDQALGAFGFAGGSSGQNNYALTLSSGLVADVEGGDDLSLRLSPADNDISYLFSSRMASPNGPELVIAATPEPDTLFLLVTGAGAFCLPRWAGRRSPRR
jgi:hypothetical protein